MLQWNKYISFKILNITCLITMILGLAPILPEEWRILLSLIFIGFLAINFLCVATHPSIYNVMNSDNDEKDKIHPRDEEGK